MSSNTETLKLIISGDGKLLGAEIGRSDRQVTGFTRKTENAFLRMGKRIGGGLKKMVTSPLAGIATGAGVLALGKQIVDFDSDLMRLGIQGKLTDEELVNLRKGIIDVGIASGQSREDVLSGINAIVERTGNIQYAIETYDTLAKSSTATGAAMEDMGALASNLNEKLDIDAEGLMTALNVLTVQGKAGAFTLKDMAANGERLMSSAGRLGIKGVNDLKKFGALLQVARMGTGSSDQATTSIERILGSIIEKQDVIKSLGFDVFNDRSKQQFKSIDEIIKGTIVRAKGNEKILGKIFGEEGIRGVSTLARLYRETGGFDIYDKLATADAERAGELLKDFARYSETASFRFKQLGEVGKQFADKVLSKSIQNLSDRMNELMSDPQKMADFQDRLDRIALAISNIADNAIKIAPVFDVMGAGIEIFTGSDQVNKSKEAHKLLKTLPKAEQKRLKGMISGKDWSSGTYNTLKREHPELFITNNIHINQDENGKVIRVTSDSSNTKNNVRVNRGKHSAVQ